MQGELPQRPVLLAALVPLPQLRQLRAHEVELLARMREHVQVQRPGLRKLELVVAPHLLRDGRLLVHHFVMRQREQVALVVVVHHRERQVVVVVPALLGRGTEEIERVVHPAHVPFVIEAEAALVHWCGDAGIVGGVLGNEHGALVEVAQTTVHVAHELHGRRVHAERLVALTIDDAADGVHAQAVEVVGTEPVVCRALQEGANLSALVVEVVASPLAHGHVAVGMLEQRRAVVVAKAVVVGGKVDRHEVEDGADARAVQHVDELHQLAGRAIAARGREEPGRLVAPRTVEGVLHERQELHVGVAGLLQIGNELVGNLAVGEPVAHLQALTVAAALVPTAQM